MKSKKGISAIVATVLIILITVAAVTIVWAAIIPMIRDQLESGTICFDAVSQIQVTTTGWTCVDSTGKNVSLQIKRGAKDFELSNVQVLISAKGTTKSFNLLEDVSGATLPGTNEERVYILDTSLMTDKPEEVQIAPIISVGNTQKTCDVSSTVVLKDC